MIHIAHHNPEFTPVASLNLTMEQALYALKDAFERKQSFEEIGFVLSSRKTSHPHWFDKN
jgi:hypothetical protein